MTEVMLGVPPCPQTHCSSSRRRLVLMGTAPRRGELGKKESQVHPTLLAPSPGSALLCLQCKPGAPSPPLSRLTPKSPPVPGHPAACLRTRSPSLSSRPSPDDSPHRLSSCRRVLRLQPKLLSPWAWPTQCPYTHLMSWPRGVPDAARGSRWARPGGPRSRGCCRIIWVRGPAGGRWDPGDRAEPQRAWSSTRGVALGARSGKVPRRRGGRATRCWKAGLLSGVGEGTWRSGAAVGAT